MSDAGVHFAQHPRGSSMMPEAIRTSGHGSQRTVGSHYRVQGSGFRGGRAKATIS